MQLKYLIIFLILLWRTGFVQAYEIVHQPPKPLARSEMQLSIPAKSLKRARVMVQKVDGLKILAMSRIADKFVARIKFTDLAVIVYKIQIETYAGEIAESVWYTLRQPGESDRESEIQKYDAQLQTLQAQVAELENANLTIRRTSSQDLRQRKDQELAKAYLTLAKRERELESIRSGGQ